MMAATMTRCPPYLKGDSAIPLWWWFQGIADAQETTSRQAGSAVGKLVAGRSFRLSDPARPLGHADRRV
jgi:hypothetical protein